jgi:hypothetical protein
MKPSACNVRPRSIRFPRAPIAAFLNLTTPSTIAPSGSPVCGRLCLYSKKINLSVPLAGQAVGVKEVEDGIWLVSFMNYDLGYIDLEEKTLQPLENPFGPKV